MKGKDKGKTGKIEKAMPKINKVMVAGVNVYRRHLKPRGEKKTGGMVDIVKPLPVANVVLICPKCEKPTRVSYEIDKQGKKERVCKKCRQII